MSEKRPKREKGKVNKEIKTFEIRINKFGQLEKNMSNEELNQFLNQNLPNKKLNLDGTEISQSEDENNQTE